MVLFGVVTHLKMELNPLFRIQPLTSHSFRMAGTTAKTLSIVNVRLARLVGIASNFDTPL